METKKQNESGSSTGENLNKQKFSLAVIIFIAYMIFIIYLATKASVDDVLWTRLLYLFTGIEAIVFAALGYVFGKDINRVRAENAEKATEKAKKEEVKAKEAVEKAKKEIQKEREKGIALSTAVKSKHLDTSSMFKTFSVGGAKDTQVGSNDYLAELAYKLYPEVDNIVTIRFNYEITPADNLNNVTVNRVTKKKSIESFSGVPIFDNSFTVHIDRKDKTKDWTIKITKIWDSNGNERKQFRGKTESNYDSVKVQLESL